jgi:uncharacterized protein (DUF2249 family)
MISGDTTLGGLLDAHPELIDVLATYHTHFKQLRNRLLRRVMAPRITVAQAARIAGVPAAELLAVIRRTVGDADAGPPEAGEPARALAAAPKPAALAALPVSMQVHVDVRDDIKKGVEPFARIMAAVKSLDAGQALSLRTPFEPVPLYDVLGKRGFAHWTLRRADDDWSVWFYRGEGGTAPEGAATAATAGAGRRSIDVRGLEPPQPMVLVLHELERLGVGERLEVIHDRRPIFLYPLLAERGFAHTTDEPQPGVVRIVIEKRGAA